MKNRIIIVEGHCMT